MVLTSTWERYVDYPLVFLGAAIVCRVAAARRRVGLPALYAMAGAALVLWARSCSRRRTACFSTSTSS